MSKIVPVIRFHPQAQLPRYATTGAAGLDLRACIETPVILDPMQRRLIPTGIGLVLEPDYEAQVRPRSGLAFTSGVTVLNAPGTIDSDYRGEIKILLINLGESRVCIQNGDRIAQLVINEISNRFEPEFRFEAGDGVAPVTDRGTGGFGSTGSL